MFKGAGAFHSAGQSKEGSGHLGPILGPSGPFWTILDKNDFFAPNGQSRGWQRCFGAKYQFLFETVQKGPDGPKRVPNGQKHLG